MKRQTSKNGIERRQFFRRFFVEALSAAQEVQGEPQMLLSDIAHLPNNTIRQMAPIICNSKTMTILDGAIRLTDSDREPGKAVYRFDSRQIFIIGWFNGNHTIESIGKVVAGQFGMEADAAVEAVKDLFLVLIKYALCIPAEAHQR